MNLPFRSPLFSVIRAELLFNRRRVAPYALLILFIANAVLWWQSASMYYGWASNGDYYIKRLLVGFLFMTTPFFVAMFFGDVISRDARYDMTPLLLSKPISKTQYLAGKFLGNFFTFTLCCAVYPMTLFILQTVRPKGMVVFPFRLTVHLRFFIVFVVVPHFALAAFCFMLGVLSRNTKLVYGAIVALYAVYVPLMAFLQSRAPGWGKLVHPFLAESEMRNAWNLPAEVVNQFVIRFDAAALVNRLAFISLGILFLSVACKRFKVTEKSGAYSPSTSSLPLGLAEKSDRLYHEESLAWVFPVAVAVGRFADQAAIRRMDRAPDHNPIIMPNVAISHAGWRAWLGAFTASVKTEFKLLRAERSLILLIPFTVLLCFAQLAPYTHVDEATSVELSARYAANIADSLLLLLFAIAVFYTGEAIARDREVRVEAVLWSAPPANSIFLLAKFAAMLLLSLCVMALAGVISMALQGYRNPGSLVLYPYFIIYAVILLPSTAFLLSASLLIQVLLREKYVAYVISLACGGGLFYLYSQGFHHWFYNPILFNLWTYSDLLQPGNRRSFILLHRVYWLAVTIACLAVSHLFFRRKSSPSGSHARGLGETGRAMLIAALAFFFSLAIAILIGQF